MRMNSIDENLRKLWEHLGREFSIEEADRMLEDIFSEVNREKFGGALPQYKYLQVNVIEGGLDGRCTSWMKWITNSPFVQPKDYMRTMTHEMIHHFVGGHSEDFQNKVREVASGEPWLEEELDRCRWIHRMFEVLPFKILEVMEDLSKHNPVVLPWIKARRIIADRAGCTIKELLEAVPNCRTVWNSYLSKKGMPGHRL